MFYHTVFTGSTVQFFYRFHRTRFYMFYRTCFKRLQIVIGTVRGSNYPLAVLCQDLSLFTLLAAVLRIEEEADEVAHVHGNYYYIWWRGALTCGSCVAINVHGSYKNMAEGTPHMSAINVHANY